MPIVMAIAIFTDMSMPVHMDKALLGHTFALNTADLFGFESEDAGVVGDV